MNRRILLGGVLIGITAITQQAQAQNEAKVLAAPQSVAAKPAKLDPSTPLVRIGDSVITVGDLENRINQTMPQFRARYATAEGKRALLNTMIENRLAYNEAVRRGLDKDPALRDRLQSFAEQLYGGELTRRVFQEIAISEEEAKTYYNGHPDEFMTPEQVRARHILLKSEEEAKAVLQQLKAGGSFEDIAKTKSVDTRSASSGGELGWFRRGLMAPEFEKTAFELPAGSLSGVVATSFGFHIIQVEEKRKAQVNSFESEKLRIVSQLKGQKQREVLEAFKKKLREEANVIIYEELLAPESVATPDLTARSPQPVSVRQIPPNP